MCSWVLLGTPQQSWLLIKDEVLSCLNARNEANKRLKYRRCAPLTAAGKTALRNRRIRGFRSRHQTLKFAKSSDFDQRRQQWSTMGVLRKHMKDVKVWMQKHKLLDDRGEPTEGAKRGVREQRVCLTVLSWPTSTNPTGSSTISSRMLLNEMSRCGTIVNQRRSQHWWHGLLSKVGRSKLHRQLS